MLTLQVVFLTFLMLANRLESKRMLCMNDCSTVSRHVRHPTYHPIKCTIQETACTVSSDRIDPAEPSDLEAKWYVYQDPQDKSLQKIGMNISWSPKDEGSVSFLKGYEISIRVPNGDGPNRKVYFCLNTPLSFHCHVKAIFYYDCVGHFQTFHPSIINKTYADVSVRSLPNGGQASIRKTLPSCKINKYDRVDECYQKKNYVAALGNVSCEQRSFDIHYNIPQLFGEHAILEFFLNNTTPVSISYQSNLPPNGIVEVNLPKEYDLKSNYGVTISGSNQMLPYKIPVFFHQCATHEYKNANSILISVLIPCIVVVVIGLCILVIISGLCYKQKVKKCLEMCNQSPPANKENAHEKESITTTAAVASTEENTKCVKIYLIFVEDHIEHTKVVLNFANYLQSDLGLDIVCELYDREEVYADPASWMEKSLAKSDKVLVIWSPGATIRWNQYNDADNIEQDLFTPVLKQIKKDHFREKNRSKYYFGYFEYCSPDDIPKIFSESSKPIFQFKLMKQFEELYFRLIDKEMYEPGAVVRVPKVAYDSYSAKAVTRCGFTLHESIQKMAVYVEENADWFLSTKSNREDDIACNLPNINDDTGIVAVNLNIHPLVESSSNSATSLSKCFQRSETEQIVLDKKNPFEQASGETEIANSCQVPKTQPCAMTEESYSIAFSSAVPEKNNLVFPPPQCPSNAVSSCVSTSHCIAEPCVDVSSTVLSPDKHGVLPLEPSYPSNIDSGCFTVSPSLEISCLVTDDIMTGCPLKAVKLEDVNAPSIYDTNIPRNSHVDEICNKLPDGHPSIDSAYSSFQPSILNNIHDCENSLESDEVDYGNTMQPLLQKCTTERNITKRAKQTRFHTKKSVEGCEEGHHDKQPFIELAPFDVDTDPMKSLMSLNKSAGGRNFADAGDKQAVVELAPIEHVVDPMMSLMAINNLLTTAK